MNLIKITFANGATSTHLVTNLELIALINIYGSAGIKYEITRLVD